MSTVWRHFAAVPITGLLLASTATIAMADTVNPPEGGVWRYGRGYSDYLHGSKKHGSSVQGVNFVRSPCVKAGRQPHHRRHALRWDVPPDTPPRSDQKEAATMMRRPAPVSLPYFLTAVVAVLMASFLLGAAETVLPSAGHPVIVLVEGTPDRNVSAVDSWMSTYSQRQHVAVGRWQADLNNPESSRGSIWFPQPAALSIPFLRVTRICHRK